MVSGRYPSNVAGLIPRTTSSSWVDLRLRKLVGWGFGDEYGYGPLSGVQWIVDVERRYSDVVMASLPLA